MGPDQATGRGGRHSRMQGWILLPAAGGDLCPDGSLIGKYLSFALIPEKPGGAGRLMRYRFEL